MHKVPLFAVIIFAVMTLLGCSAARQTYHNITARNNAYFNGDQKLKSIQRNVAASCQDKFDTLLVLRTERQPQLAKTYGTDLDEVIKKASYAIKRHESSRWTDDSYLLVGKAYFLKANYDAALEAFKYINTEFKDGVKKSDKKKKDDKKKKKKNKSSKKKKKKSSAKKPVPVKADVKTQSQTVTSAAAGEQKKKSSLLQLLKPAPVRSQALIWMVDTYTEQAKYKEADAVITLIEAEESFPKKLKRELAVSKAHLAIRRGSPERAVQPLTQAITFSKKKKYKARYYYVLGQIYEMNKQYPNSLDNYRQVLKNRPKFDMEFNAKLSIARVAGFDQSMSSEEITRLLTRLLKDRRNKDFYDQIYFSLAELARSRGDKKKTIEYLEKSVKTSTANTYQKAIALHRLAEIYFNDENYVKAQAYYDSTAAIIPADYVHFSLIQSRAEILKELIRQMQIVEEQDSLLYIASLPEKERNKFIDGIFREKEKAGADNASSGTSGNPAVQQNNGKNNNATASLSGWYFYNTTAKASGYNNFIKKWGKRALEDNWRRSNKNSSASADIQTGPDAYDEASISLSDTNLDRTSLLEALPLTEEKMKKSHHLIAEALYAMGNIYRVELKNRKKAIESFEELVKRFPQSRHLPEACYNLYILYNEKGDPGKAEHYKNMLLSKFPESTYARYIINPELLEEQRLKDRLLNDYYGSVYEMYLNNRLEEALAAIRRADTLFPQNALKPKFALLEAQTIDKSKDLPKYLDALQAVIDRYPATAERKKAEEIINYLKVNQDSTYQMQINISEYKYDADAIHFFLIAFNSDSVKSSDLTNDIASYNDLNRSLETLTLNAVSLNNRHTFLVVKSFKNMKAAVNYYNAIRASTETFQKYPANAFRFCIISDVNFNKVITHREIESYFKFFEARYITNP